jgi:hypothetical protein
MKSIARSFFSAAVAASVFAFAARADAGSRTVYYIDENGNVNSADVKLITSACDYEGFTLEKNNGYGGRYGVTEEV